MRKVISYKFSKGPKFARQLVKEETDLTAEMLARYDSSSMCQSVSEELNTFQWDLEYGQLQTIQLQSFGCPDWEWSFTSLYRPLLLAYEKLHPANVGL